jgi:hypothetical protein
MQRNLENTEMILGQFPGCAANHGGAKWATILVDEDARSQTRRAIRSLR